MKGGCSAPLAWFLAATVWVSLSAARPDQSRPPANLHVESTFRLIVDRMWEASPTFRRQCRRLAEEPSLLVTVSQEDQSAVAFLADAWTTLTFKEDRPVAARVHVKPVSNRAELIAHELEHILEQLDRVDLQAQAGNGTVWKNSETSFETRRAIEAGQRVAREIMKRGTGDQAARTDSDTVQAVPRILKLRDRDATATSPPPARVSRDGRYVVFTSSARLSEEDRNHGRDVYVTDLATGQTTLESGGVGGAPADGDSLVGDISGDGRYAVFESVAGNLTTRSYLAGTLQVFLRDRRERTTRLLTARSDGAPANGPSTNPMLSANGAIVVFESGATDLVPTTFDGGQRGVGIYAIWLATGVRRRIDVGVGGGSSAAGSSMTPSISADGRYVAFASKADLTCRNTTSCAEETMDLNRHTDIYLRDLKTGTTTRVSRSQSGGDADGASYDPAVSGDGRVIAFVSEATNLTREPTGRWPQIYAQDVATGRTELVSRAASGRAGNGSSLRPALSFDGSAIAFQSLATNLLCERHCPSSLQDINLLWDVFVHDRAANRTVRTSGDGRDEWMEASRGPSIDDAGRVVAFGSWHPTDVTDTAHDEDLYVTRMKMLNVDF